MSQRDKAELFGNAGKAKGVGPPAARPAASTAAPAPRTSSTAAASRTTSAAAAPKPADSAASRERHSQQRKEAAEARAVAEGYMTKNWKRWNCNYFSAAPYFEKAAASYRACGEEEDALAMYTQAGECQVICDLQSSLRVTK